jgi:hypothetical protein
MDIALDEFGLTPAYNEYGRTTGGHLYLHGTGAAQDVLSSMYDRIEDAYADVLSDEEFENFTMLGNVPVIRDGEVSVERIRDITLRDLPAVLDTLATLEARQQKHGPAGGVYSKSIK